MSREKTAIPDDLLQLSQRLEAVAEREPAANPAPGVDLGGGGDGSGMDCTAPPRRCDWITRV